MVTIPLGVTNEDYRSHISSALGASMGMDNTLMDRALATFTSAGTVLSVFRTDPCLFPRYKTYSIEDYSIAQVICYPSQEGARMVKLTQEALQRTERTTAPKRKDIVTDGILPSSSVMKRQTTLKQSATGRLGLQLPFVNAKDSDGSFQPKIVTIEQLKANRAAEQQFNKEWMSKQPSNLVQWDWSEYPDATESIQLYIDTLMFHSVWERELKHWRHSGVAPSH
jgi:hypothetical protein